MNRLVANILACTLLVALAPESAVALDSYVFATTTDFSTGAASWVELEPPRVPHPFVESISSDPVCRWAFGRIYVVNRFGFDNIQILDPGNSFVTMLQFSVYARYCASEEASQVHRKRISGALPPDGEVRLMTLTDRQFGKMQVFHGKKRREPEHAPQQLELF